MTDRSKHEESLSSRDEFITCSEIGKVEEIKRLLKTKVFKESDLDKALRACINKYNPINPDFFLTFEELLANADLNYEQNDGTTPLMIACAKGNSYIIKKIFEHCKSSNLEINLGCCDINGWNVFHYILNKNLHEEEALENCKEILEYNNNYRNKKSKIQKFSNEKLLKQKDNKGNFIITKILENGWFKMLIEFFKYVKGYDEYFSSDFALSSNGNNLLHCAIEGGNYLCIKEILMRSSPNILKCKNKEGLTCIDLAIKKKYTFTTDFLGAYVRLSHKKKQLLQHFYIHLKSAIEMIISFTKGDYQDTIDKLIYYQINKSILNEPDSISYEWNLLLSEQYLNMNKDIREEHILSKFKDNSDTTNNNNSNNKVMLYSKFHEFFNKHSNKLNLTQQHQTTNEFNNVDIIIYNKVIFFFKLGETNTAINLIKSYMSNNPLMLNNNNNTSTSINEVSNWICNINFYFLLIEYFISIHNYSTAQSQIKILDTHLITINKEMKQHDEKELVTYLNESEVINPFTKWDESLCYLDLLRALCNLNTNEHLKSYKNRLNNCSYKDELKIFKRLQSIYTMIKAKRHFILGNNLKSIKKVNLIRENYFDLSYEHKVCYYNSMGIFNLKNGNYILAEYMFKTGINIYKKIYSEYTNVNSINSKQSKRSMLVMSYNNLVYIKYNLGLCLFSQGKYFEAMEVFKELINLKCMGKNAYLWYRLALTHLEIYLSKVKQNKFHRTIGYNYKKEINENKGTIAGKDKEYCDDNITNDTNNYDENDDDELEVLFDEYEKTLDSYHNNNDYNHYSNINMNYSYRGNNNNNNRSNSTNVYTHHNNNKKSILTSKHNNYITNTFSSSLKNKQIPTYQQPPKRILFSHHQTKDDNTNNSNNNNTNTNASSTINEYLINSISSFKQTIIMLKQPMHYYPQSPCTSKVFSLNPNSSKETPPSYLPSIYAKNPSILFSSYLNLLFCYSLSHQWTNSLFLISSLTSNKTSKYPNDFIIKLYLYKIEALLNLNRIEDAVKQINELQTQYKDSIECYIDLYSKDDCNLIKKTQYQMYLSLGNIILLINQQKYIEAENELRKVITTYYNNKSVVIPNYLYKLMLYIYMHNKEYNKNICLKILKNQNIEIKKK